MITNVVVRALSPAKQFWRHGVRLHATIAADSLAQPTVTETGGFGFSADELAEAKPYTDIPSLKEYPFVGNLLSFKPFGKLDPYHRPTFCAALYKEHGDIVRMSLPFISYLKRVVTIMDPKDIEIVYRNEGRYPSRQLFPILKTYRESRNYSLGLFLSNNEEWWKYRQPLNKGMMRANAATPYLDVQDPIGDELVSRIRKVVTESGSNLHTNIIDDISRYALESIGAIVFDRRMGCMAIDLDPNSWQRKFIESVNGSFRALITLSYDPIYVMYEKVGYKSKLYKDFWMWMDFISETSLKLIQESKENWLKTPEEELKRKFLPQLLNMEGIDMDQKVSVIFDMMFAAIDTTTYTTLRAAFLLAKNPDAQEKLYQEINENVGTLSSVNFSKLPYLRACIKESHRMMPVGTAVIRELLRDIVIQGYRIPTGTIVYLEHEYASNCERYVSDHALFKPERWIRGVKTEEDKIHPFTALPFGFGPRMCIGKRFAEQELYIAIIKLVKNFRIEYDGDTLPLKGIGQDKPPIHLNFKFYER